MGHNIGRCSTAMIYGFAVVAAVKGQAGNCSAQIHLFNLSLHCHCYRLCVVGALTTKTVSTVRGPPSGTSTAAASQRCISFAQRGASATAGTGLLLRSHLHSQRIDYWQSA